MNKKGQDYPTVTAVELGILLLIIGMLAYVFANANISNDVNNIRARDLGLTINLISSFDNNVKFTYNLEDERHITFINRNIEVSNKDGSHFEKSKLNLNKKIIFYGKGGNYQGLTIKKTGNNVDVK
ncbi:MAG: hypothetical protein AABX29_05245 [Nanoarchaeota archaeon]